VTLALYWNYSDAGLSVRRNRYYNELIDPSMYPSATMPLTSGVQLPSKVRFPVSLSTSSASASFTRFGIFLFVSFILFFFFNFFSFSLRGLHGTFSDGRYATIHSRLEDYSELTPLRVNSRICRGQFKSHVSHIIRNKTARIRNTRIFKQIIARSFLLAALQMDNIFDNTEK